MYAVRSSHDYVTIGESPKMYDNFKEAQEEIEVLEKLEDDLFGNVTTRYEVDVWAEDYLSI